MSETTTIAAFDLGIKNLSYCVADFDGSGGLVAVRRWANLNLLADGAESQSQTRCGSCAGPASWIDRCAAAGAGSAGPRLWCKKCVKKGAAGAKPPLELTAKSPKLADWRTWAQAQSTALGITETEAKRLTKAAIEERAGTIRLLPYKAPKAKGVTLQSLLAAMETCLTTELTHLSAATRIRLENQPAEFAPHMKSIQIMLFTLIDHRLRTEYGWTGTMEFASAGVKTRGTGAGTGKDAKRSRKLAGIQRVTAILTAAGGAGAAQLTWWSAQAKQDDLADALLMCCDAVASSPA